MNGLLDRARRWWRARSAGEREALKATFVLVCAAALWAAWDGVGRERTRSEARAALAEARLERMQDEIAELERLRARVPAPRPQGGALAATVAESLKGRGLGLTLTVMDDARLRLQGEAGFDETVAWLGAVQRDYRLRTVNVTALRQGETARIDLILRAPAP